MKSIFKRCYLVSVLSLALMGSASASLQIQVTSSQSGLGDGSGCTLEGAIKMAGNNTLPYQTYGCDKTLTTCQEVVLF